MIRHKFQLAQTLCFSLILFAAPLCAEETIDPAATTEIDHRLELNYQGVTNEGNAGSVSEYGTFEPGMGFNLDLKGHVGKKHLYLDATYTNDRDYMAEAHVDLNGRFKINLASERLWHNLDHIPYEPGIPGARDPGITTAPVATRVTFDDQNPGKEYGVRIEIDKAEVISKLGNYPAHIRLKYWRLQKEGEKQLRFSDEGHTTSSSCNVCHVQSKTLAVDRLTEEFSGEIDAHIGFIDMTFEQILRTFRVKDPIPEDVFGTHSRFGGGTFQHSEDPESQLLQSTVSLRTALSGGLVVDGAYTYGKRENNSDLAGQPLGVDGVSAETDYQKLASNLSYTPISALTINLRYRMFDLDTNNSDTVTAAYTYIPTAGATSGPPLTFPVRENLDTNRYEYAASASWRPMSLLTVRGDYQRETIKRGGTGPDIPYSSSTASIERSGIIDPVWDLPEEENIDQYRLSLTLRPLKSTALRVNTWYRYITSDAPAYGTSFDDKHEAFFGVNYNGKSRWGTTATARATQEKYDDNVADRDREQQNCDLGVWVNPLDDVTTGLNYGYARTLIEQDIFFATTIQDQTDYLQYSQNVSAFVTVQLLKSLSTRIDGYYVRSLAKYTPSFSTALGVYPATSDGLSAISRLDVVQQGLNAGIDWNPAERWTVGLTYTLDDYDARNSDVYDGTTQSCMVSLARTW